MIQTLRLTGVAAVAFAGLVLASVLGPVSLIHLDDNNDQRMGRILAAPGAVERFHELHGDKSTVGSDAEPPLVKQARLFKEIIDPKLPPPSPAAQAAAPSRRETIKVKPPVTSAKFTLIGTSCSASDPNLSLAYIRDAQGPKWVQCGDPVGYLVIKEVRKDSVICWDGRSESTIPMEPVPDRVSLLEVDDASAPPSATAAPQPVEAQVTGTAARPTRFSNPPVSPERQSAMPRMNENEQQAVSELVDRLKQLRDASRGDANAATEAERLALANKVIAELRSSRVSPQETRKLENLGDEIARGGEQAREQYNQELLKRLNAVRSSKD